uniref:Cubilin n=1 Tax=Plectus sambesii TaxID=2011161 RepID=A0A914UJS2_9BILA
INTAIDLLQCFQRETACHPPQGPCYVAPCKNGGTCNPNGNTGYTCNCAQSFSGTTCETVACGTTIIPVDGTGGQLRSLNFPDLTFGYNCTWSLQASSEYFIELTINSITTTDDPPGQIYFQVVDVLSSNPQIYNTSTSVADKAVNSSRQRLDVKFKTGLSLIGGSPGSFDISYRSVYADVCSSLPPNYCGNGNCTQDNYVAQCKCQPCFTGPQCDVPKPDPCAGVTICGDHGYCTFDENTCSNPSCACISNCTETYSGPFCTLSTPMNFDCGNGTCKYGSPGRNSSCVCSDSCHIYSPSANACILDENNCLSNGEICGDHGTCEPYLNNGVCSTRCVCSDQYTGDLCNTPPI